jgi:two-component system cell cycle response regulator
VSSLDGSARVALVDAPGPPVSDYEEPTRVTAVGPVAAETAPSLGTDCIIVIYTKQPTLLGKRYVLDVSPTKLGRGADNEIVLDGDSVSRRHAAFERRADGWYIVDNGSTNGTYLNDNAVANAQLLANGDRVKVGPTIFRFLSGADVEAQYHEEIYKLTIIDGLTQAYNARYLYESLEREMTRSRRHERPLSVLMFDIDHFKRINDVHGHIAGDFVLKELARIVQQRVRRDEVFARYGGEEFSLILPETTLEGAISLGETLRQRIEEHSFAFQDDEIRATISMGVVQMIDQDKSASELMKRADALLYEAKRGGRNRVRHA